MEQAHGLLQTVLARNNHPTVRFAWLLSNMHSRHTTDNPQAHFLCFPTSGSLHAQHVPQVAGTNVCGMQGCHVMSSKNILHPVFLNWVAITELLHACSLRSLSHPFKHCPGLSLSLSLSLFLSLSLPHTHTHTHTHYNLYSRCHSAK
jgi:hypothetical protein